MRRGDKPYWLINETNGDLIGLNLSASFCAEHEWGIKELKQSLGVNENLSVLGIERRRAQVHNPKFLTWYDEGGLIGRYNYSDEVKPLNSFSEIKLHKYSSPDDLAAAWSGSDFGIQVTGEKNIKKLRKLYDAFLAKEVAVWLGGAKFIENSGLILAIIKNIPEESLKEMYDADVSAENLKKEHEKIGIVARLDKLNEEWRETHPRDYNVPFGYFACSPKWKHGVDSKYKVMYWLNPMQQDKVNFGWFTVEQLEQWIEGKGPIPKSEEQKRKRSSY